MPEAGDCVVSKPVPASQISNPQAYRRVASAATGVCAARVRAPRYRTGSELPVSSRTRSKVALTKEKDTTKGYTKDGRQSLSKHPYERVDKKVRQSKAIKGSKHLQGVPAELLAHDPTAAAPTLRSSTRSSSASSSTTSSPKRKSSPKKSSPSPKKSKSKSKSPSPESVTAAAKKAAKKAKGEATKRRVKFALDLAVAAQGIIVPPVLPGPVMRSHAADSLAASLAALSIGVTA
ncbi:hypothetical protein AURDEDRAFT_112279 [Auricularia subglabra TFB-10046 SS5]|nr:hypothetical protein AURDEDRAFT_112279 [Auricularia subglabra TFB-10046 SS5]